MGWSPTDVLVAPDELRSAQQYGQQRVPDPWMADVVHQMGESSAWYEAVCRVPVPQCPVHVELLSGLPMLLAQRPQGVEVYNDLGQSATDFFRCLRMPPLHVRFTQLHWKYGGVNLSPEKLAQLARQHDNRMVRTYCWFRLALGLFQHRRTDRGLWRDRPMEFEVLDHNDPWAKDLYSMLTDIDQDLPGLHGRLMRVQFEQNTWEKMLELYDGPDTVFWIDAQPGLLRRQGAGASPAEFIRRLEKLRGSFVMLWWKPDVPKPLWRWKQTHVTGTSFTLVTKVE